MLYNQIMHTMCCNLYNARIFYDCKNNLHQEFIMDDLSPSALKAILHQNAPICRHLEHCRVMQKDGRVLYLTEGKDENYLEYS